MAGDWLKFETSTLDKPEVFAIATRLGLDPDTVIGKLLRLWKWFDSNTTDGNARGVTPEQLDRVTYLPGFATAVHEVGWLIVEGGGVRLPNFERHNGETAKARALGKVRVQAHRARNAATVTPETPPPSTPPLPEKRREEVSHNNNHHPARPIGTLPEALDYAASYSKGNALALTITADIVNAWWDARTAVGWVTVKGQLEMPITDWQADLRQYARHWRDRDRERAPTPGPSPPLARGARLPGPPAPPSPWSIQQHITAAEDEIRTLMGIDKFDNLPTAKQNQIRLLRQTIKNWRTQLTAPPPPSRA